MRDFWLTQYLLSAAGWAYLALAVGLLGASLWLPRRVPVKIAAGLITLAVLSILPIRAYNDLARLRAGAKVVQDRHAKAMSLFHQRCELAGQRIHRSVSGVTGVLLQGRRRQDIRRYEDRTWDGAGFPEESVGNQYAIEFLFFNVPPEGTLGRHLRAKPGGTRGYSYVDVAEGETVQRYVLRAKPALGVSDPLSQYADRVDERIPLPRYSVKYEDIPDPEGRAQWIAGGRLTVVDRITNETLGEFIHYAYEPGFGNTDGGRLPWVHALQCPASGEQTRRGQIRFFVERVIRPTQGG